MLLLIALPTIFDDEEALARLADFMSKSASLVGPTWQGDHAYP